MSTQLTAELTAQLTAELAAQTSARPPHKAMPPLAERLARITPVQARPDDSRDAAAWPAGQSEGQYVRLKTLFEPLGFDLSARTRLRFRLADPDTDGETLHQLAVIVWHCYAAHPAEFEAFLPYIGCRMYRDSTVPQRVHLMAHEQEDGFVLSARVDADISHLPPAPLLKTETGYAPFPTQGMSKDELEATMAARCNAALTTVKGEGLL